MFGLTQLEGGKKKKKSEAAQSKDVRTDDIRQGFHSKDMQENSEVFLNHGNFVGKSENKNKI